MKSLAKLLAALVPLFCCLVLAFLWSRGSQPQREPSGPSAAVRYRGMCDASAAVPLDDKTFVVADDEQNLIRIYRTAYMDQPVQVLAWDPHLGYDVRRKDRHEADIEGATVRGNRIYWISSHGRNNDGEWKPDRHRFFAMDIEKTGEGFLAKPVGKPYVGIALDLVADERMTAIGLGEALAPEKKTAKKLAPKRSGLNIEGLAATPDEKSLLIAFRNPRPEEKPLIVPLLNPDAVLLQGAAPQFGDPINLQLAGNGDEERVLGIRSIEYSRRHGLYLIVAGSHDEKGLFGIYQWSGRPLDAARLLPKASAAIANEDSFSPEGLILYPEEAKIQLLSDDGSQMVQVASSTECRKGAFRDGQCEAKSLLDDRQKTFRSLWVNVE